MPWGEKSRNEELQMLHLSLSLFSAVVWMAVKGLQISAEAVGCFCRGALWWLHVPVLCSP